MGKTHGYLVFNSGAFWGASCLYCESVDPNLYGCVKPDSFLLLGEFQWKLIVGIVLSLASAVVIFGGLQSIVKVTSSSVPLMVSLYFFLGLYILLSNAGEVLPTFGLIFSSAFDFQTAVTGGFWGLVFLGVRRVVFPNESGVGNLPMYHGQS